MKLDLLYEIDAPRPWDDRTASVGPAGTGAAGVRRDARPGEARRRARLQRGLVRRAPLPGGTVALPGPRGGHRRVDAGDREHPPRLRGDAAPVRLHAPDARGGEGGDRRHPLAGSHRVGHRSLHADGADRVPRRPRSESRRVGRGHRDHLRDVARGVLRVGQPHVPVPAPAGHAEAVPGSAPAGLDGRDVGGFVGRRRLEPARPALVFDHATARQDGSADPGVPRRVEQPGREADLRRRHQQGRGLHAGALRGDERPGARQRGLGIGRVVVPEHRPVHARLGAPAPRTRRAGRPRSRC